MSDFWEGFWHDKMRTRMVSRYYFAPFLEEAGTLLLASKYLWHPWSVRRRDELTELAYKLKGRAKAIRRSGLAWACNESAFGQDPAHLLSASVYYRYHGNTDIESYPEAAPYLVSAAAKILMLILPALEKLEVQDYEEKGWVRWTSEIIETLMESTYIGSVPEISEEAVRCLGIHAVFLECEGLAATQAILEDNFDRKHGRPRRKKSSGLSEEQLRKLADEIGMSFETVKEVLETEFSSWWGEAKKYIDHAEEQKTFIISSLGIDDSIMGLVKSAWDDGMTHNGITHNGSMNDMYYSEGELGKSENIIKTIIAMFLNAIDSDHLFLPAPRS